MEEISEEIKVNGGNDHRIMKFAIVLIALCGAAITAGWFPYAAYVAVSRVATAWESMFTLLYVIEVCFFVASALPCFYILINLWRTSRLVAFGRLFSADAVAYFSHSAKILFCDIIFFFVGNLIFFFIGANFWVWLYIFIDVCGLAVALLFYIISKCLDRAKILQEESDGTI